MDSISCITAILEESFTQESAADFPVLRRIPCTAVIKFLDYYASLALAERESLREVLARIGAMRFFPPPQFNEEFQQLRITNPAYAEFLKAMQSQTFGYGLRYSGVKMTKLMVNDAETTAFMTNERCKLGWQPRDDPPQTLVSDPDLRNLHPAKAPLLRKLTGSALEQLFSAEKKKLPGGETGYSGILGGRHLTVWVDFGSSLAQLRYGLSTPDAARRIFVSRLSFEDLWVTSLGWDYLTEENAAGCIELLCEQIKYLVQLVERILASQ